MYVEPVHYWSIGQKKKDACTERENYQTFAYSCLK